MRTETIRAAQLVKTARLDSRYYLSEGVKAAARLDRAVNRGIDCSPLGGENGLAEVWQPGRFVKKEAAREEEGAPYLRPYDVFEYLPRAADYLSVRRTPDYEKCVLKRGMILQSCSGRNLGPAVFVDAYLAKFIVGSDMIRIEIKDETMRYYILAYLQSETGQQLLTQGKTGAVIDHVSKDHIKDLSIPFVDNKIRDAITSKMAEAIKLRESARLGIDSALSKFEQNLPRIKRRFPEKNGWTVRAKNLTNRLDAASYDPLVKAVRKDLKAMGGVKVDTVAEVVKPSGWYKTNYVEKAYGHPILSGTQLLQAKPINLRYIAPKALKNPSKFILHKGWIAYQADGRAEDGLGLPVMITSDRDGWLASGHVGRIKKKEGTDLNWLFLALRSQAALTGC